MIPYTVPIKGIKTKQTVTPSGEYIRKLIHGVMIRYTLVHLDERGTTSEIYDSRWGITEEPLITVVKVTVRQGRTKGWSMHLKHTDRVYVLSGAARIVLYDNREDSATYKMINEIFLGEERPGLLTIPPNVFHAVQNIGSTDVTFLDMPTRAYDHEDPDRYRLPLDSKEIPFNFDLGHGW